MIDDWAPHQFSRNGTLVTESANVNGMRVVEHLTQKYAREIASYHETQPDLHATHRLHEDTKLPDPDETLIPETTRCVLQLRM